MNSSNDPKIKRTVSQNIEEAIRLNEEENISFSRAAELLNFGIGKNYIYRARTIYKSAHGLIDDPTEVVEHAKNLLRHLDAGILRVNSAYDSYRTAKNTGRIPPILGLTKVNKFVTSENISYKPKTQTADDQRRTFTNSLPTLEGVCHGLRKITEIHSDITEAEKSEWGRQLYRARRDLDIMIKRIRKAND